MLERWIMSLCLVEAYLCARTENSSTCGAGNGLKSFGSGVGVPACIVCTSLVYSSRILPNMLSMNPSLSHPPCSPCVWCLCVWQWVWPPSMLSHALLSIGRLWHYGSTTLPFASTCFSSTFWLTTVSSLCLWPSPHCLWLSSSSFGPSLCSQAFLAFCLSHGEGWCVSFLFSLQSHPSLGKKEIKRRTSSEGTARRCEK